MPSTAPRSALRRLLLACAAFSLCSPLLAQEAWPTKPITLISPFAPGGTSDALARILAEKLQVRLGQTVIVDAKPGAGGNVGTGYVAKAKPDGSPSWSAPAARS